MPDLPKLSRATATDPDLARLAALPERVLQFGGGNFLRGFADLFIDKLNRAGVFNGRIVVVQSTAGGRADSLNAQGGLFTVVERGMKNGERVDRPALVASVSRGLSASSQWAEVLAVARSPELRVVISNTTEAGIATDPADTLAAPKSFPAKLAAVLHERFKTFGNDESKGLIVLPCELIERNGQTLQKLVKELAAKWSLPATFGQWLDRACAFADTLVDRIVPGYPADDAAAIFERLGYRDDLLVAVEPYTIWVIQGPASIRAELPFERVTDAVWADDLAPYRERKVRILNGGHTGMALAAFLAGKDTVGQCMDDPAIRAYLTALIHQNVIGTLKGDRDELKAYAGEVFERFANPFVRHQLLAISLNSTAKFKARLLPTIRDCCAKGGCTSLPLAFSLAALLAFYRAKRIEDGKLIGDRNGTPYPIQDSPAVLEAFKEVWSEPTGSADDVARLVRRALGDRGIWGDDLTTLGDAFLAAVSRSLHGILEMGVAHEMARVTHAREPR